MARIRAKFSGNEIANIFFYTFTTKYDFELFIFLTFTAKLVVIMANFTAKNAENVDAANFALIHKLF